MPKAAERDGGVRNRERCAAHARSPHTKGVACPTRHGRLFGVAWAAALAIVAATTPTQGAEVDAKYRMIAGGAHWSANTLGWYYAPAGQPAWASPEVMVPVVQRAMDLWSAQCGVQFRYLGVTAQQSTLQDGASVIGWVPSLSSAANTSWYYQGGAMVEADIQLNVGANGNASAAFPLILHELGHAIGLDHSAARESVMAGPPVAPAYSYATTLTADDVAGCQALYGASTQPPVARTPEPSPITQPSFPTAPSTVAADTVVAEFYHPVLDHYFVTGNAAERQSLAAGGPDGQWRATGYVFKAWSTAAPGTYPMCRFYGDSTIDPSTGKRRGPDSHFYTANPDECAAVPRQWPVWVLEGHTFYAALPDAGGTCPAGMQPVFRFFRPQGDPNHRYATNDGVKADMVARGWIAEGATWCAGT